MVEEAENPVSTECEFWCTAAPRGSYTHMLCTMMLVQHHNNALAKYTGHITTTLTKMCFFFAVFVLNTIQIPMYVETAAHMKPERVRTTERT